MLGGGPGEEGRRRRAEGGGQRVEGRGGESGMEDRGWRTGDGGPGEEVRRRRTGGGGPREVAGEERDQVLLAQPPELYTELSS